MDLIALAQQAITGDALSFEIHYGGSFDDSCVLTEDDPVIPTKSFKMGYAIGHAFGSVSRWLCGSNKKPDGTA